jgi:hypothetical protein
VKDIPEPAKRIKDPDTELKTDLEALLKHHLEEQSNR